MSNSPSFGRDAEEFLRKIGVAESKTEASAYGIRITAIQAAGSEKRRVRVLVSNPSGREESEFLVMNIHAEELSLAVGEIDESTITELEYYAEVAKAYSSACSSFAFVGGSYSALYKKLLGKGFPKDVSEDAIDCLRRTGVVREDEIALRRAQIFVEKRWGRIRIRAKLREEGFHDGSLSLAIEYLDEVDFASACAQHIEKKYGRLPTDERERRSMLVSLARMGYSSAEIREAMRILIKNK